MDLVQGALIVAALIGGGWFGYKLGWQAHKDHQRQAEEEDRRAFQELSLILTHDEPELRKLDEEFGCNAVGRLRSMSPEAVAALRAGKGALFDELSDRLHLQERRSERMLKRLEADPDVDPDTKAIFLRTPSTANG